MVAVSLIGIFNRTWQAESWSRCVIYTDCRRMWISSGVQTGDGSRDRGGHTVWWQGISCGLDGSSVQWHADEDHPKAQLVLALLLVPTGSECAPEAHRRKTGPGRLQHRCRSNPGRGPDIQMHGLRQCTKCCNWTLNMHLQFTCHPELGKKYSMCHGLPSGKEWVHLGSKCDSNVAVQLIDLGPGCHVIMSIPSKMGKGYSMLC